jgi:hypothetical protein
MNEKAHKGRPRTVYEERDDGKNSERFDAVARHVLSVPYKAVKKAENAPAKARATPLVGRTRKSR